jgi:hypothetical protein
MARPAPLLVLAALTACAGGGGANHDLQKSDLTGTWDVYLTFNGQPERGPDATAWQSIPGGYGLRWTALCSTYLVPNGHMDLAGELHGTTIALTSPEATWQGTVSDDRKSMSGTFVDTRGSGTWRAVRDAQARCATYEVWGGTTDLGCGSVEGYNPELYGYTLLGTAAATHTFTGQYPWYYVLTRDLTW